MNTDLKHTVAYCKYALEAIEMFCLNVFLSNLGLCSFKTVLKKSVLTRRQFLH